MSIMNPKEKKLWVTELRSGQYTQGRGRLRTPYESFCCLGVAVCAITGAKPRLGVSMLRGNRFGLSTLVQKALASVNDGIYNKIELETAYKKAGFDSHPEVSKRGKSTFNQIADWIEKNL